MRSQGIEDMVFNIFIRTLSLILGIILTFFAATSSEVRADEESGLEQIVRSSKARCVLVSTSCLTPGDSLCDALVEGKQFCCSGVIIERNVVLTNSHVLGSCKSVFVDGYQASILRRSEGDDLLLLSVTTRNIPRLKFRELPESSEPVFYISNPGINAGSVFTGKIVKVDRNFVYTDCFTDITAAKGASGSGLYSLDGELIGIKKGMLPGANGGSALSVAIPAQKIRKFLSLTLGAPVAVSLPPPITHSLSSRRSP
jgi:S1-C subfamily serine protease